MRDVGQMIIDDHKIFRKEIKELMDSTDSEIEKRKSTLDDLLRRLAAHHVAEEKTVFPAMLQIPAVRRIGFELIEEHRAMEILYSDLRMTGYGKEIWVPRIRPILEIHETHMAREETGVLPKAGDLFTKAQLEDFGNRFYEYREEEMKKDQYTWRDCSTAAAERLR